MDRVLDQFLATSFRSPAAAAHSRESSFRASPALGLTPLADGRQAGAPNFAISASSDATAVPVTGMSIAPAPSGAVAYARSGAAERQRSMQFDVRAGASSASRLALPLGDTSAGAHDSGPWEFSPAEKARMMASTAGAA